MSREPRSAPRLAPQWTEDRSSRVRAALAERARRRRVLVRSGLSIGVAAAAAVLAVVLTHSVPRDAARVFDAASAARPVPAPAASSLVAAGEPADVTTLLDPASVVVPEPEPGHRAYRLEHGGARFTVVHDGARPFRVRVGSALVEDVGTVFTLRRLSDVLAEVAVEEGRVRVTAAGASFDVGAAERRTFPTDAADAGAAPEPEPRAAPVSSVASWRPLAENGRFGEAYAAMKATGPGSVRDEAEELLLAADVARLSKHPADAVPYLERLLRSRPSDPRVGIAAFTLGRVLLEDLGRPAEAASAFARARKAGGPLAEDALARQVEALSRSGDSTGARALALEYLKAYPNGRRTRRVVKFGGVD